MKRVVEKDQSGVTLVELLIVIIIMGIVSTMILGTRFALSKTYASATQSAEQRDHAQMAMERLTRELRDAQAAPAPARKGLGHLGHRAWSLHPYAFNTTFNMAAARDSIHGRLQLVRYRLVGTTVVPGARRAPTGSSARRRSGRKCSPRTSSTPRTAPTSSQYYYYDGTGDLRSIPAGRPACRPTRRGSKRSRSRCWSTFRPGHSPDVHEDHQRRAAPQPAANF